MRLIKVLSTIAMLLAVFMLGCKKDTFVEKVGVCPAVVSTNPSKAATLVPLNQIITVNFNEKMNPATITKESFTLQGVSPIAGKKLNPST